MDAFKEQKRELVNLKHINTNLSRVEKEASKQLDELKRRRKEVESTIHTKKEVLQRELWKQEGLSFCGECREPKDEKSFLYLYLHYPLGSSGYDFTINYVHEVVYRCKDCSARVLEPAHHEVGYIRREALRKVDDTFEMYSEGMWRNIEDVLDTNVIGEISFEIHEDIPKEYLDDLDSIL